VKEVFNFTIPYCEFVLARLHPASADQGYGECDGEVRRHGEEPGGAAYPAAVWRGRP